VNGKDSTSYYTLLFASRQSDGNSDSDLVPTYFAEVKTLAVVRFTPTHYLFLFCGRPGRYNLGRMENQKNETIEIERATARRGLVIYFAVLIVGSAYFESKILQTGESIDKVPGLVLAWMFMPAVASIVARLALREGFADVSLRLGGREGASAVFLGWVYPIAVGFLTYGIAWATGLAEFQRPLSPRSHLFVDSAVANFLASFLITATLGTAVNCLAAFGEEVGWRGYMLTRLVMSGVPRPVFISGVIWAFWHVPLILSGQYAAGSQPWLSAILFVISTVAAAYLAAYLRLKSGSVWPAVITHGAWNAIIQGTFDRATAGKPQAAGESGWLTTIVSIVIMLLVTRGAWTLQRRPGKRLTLPSGRPASILTV
jgi:membrane protease YdiL (CAAX protease family)